MAEIRPFRGVRYNQGKISTLAEVLCPPYDIISLQLQDKLYRKSEYNFVRIEFNRETPQDNPQDNRYTRALANITQWLKQGILKADPNPGIYIHEHHFTCLGKRYQRRNILAAVKLAEWDTRIVRPHENIIPKAKSDRMSMLRACQVNTSEVLAMFEDSDNKIDALIAAEEKNIPVVEVTDSDGDLHKIWAVNRPDSIRQFQQALADQPLYIADGHHRYDSALTYRRERVAQEPQTIREEGYNFVMMSLMAFNDPGVVILPTHRLLKGLSSVSLVELKSRLSAYFEVQEADLRKSDDWTKIDALLTGGKADNELTRLAMYGPESGKISVLTLKKADAVRQFMPADRSELYKTLDVSIVDHVMLDEILKFDKDLVEGGLIYTHDRAEAVSRVNRGEYQLAFILNPVKPETIKGIADAGDRMPRKSTYFYPKSPAGLVFYKW